MKHWMFTSLALAIGCWAAAGTFVSAGEADEMLSRFYKEYLDECARLRPLEATRLGDHRYDGLLEDLSRTARDGWTALDRKTLRELPKRVDRSKLSRAGQVDFAIFQHELVKSIWQAENLHPFEEDPRVYSGYLSDSVYQLLSQSTLPKETNITHCLARMEQLPRIVASAKANLRRPPRIHTETAIRQNRGAIGFYEKELFDLAGPTPQLEALKASARRVVVCLKEYQQFLEKELLPRATGEWCLGREKFCRKFEMELDAGFTADQFLASVERDFERVEYEMYALARPLWTGYFPQQLLPPDDVAGRHLTVRKVLARISQVHGEPKDLVSDAQATVARLKKFIQDHDLLRLPQPDRCQIIEMPEFQRGNTVAFMNAAPPLDLNAASFYAISPPPQDWDAARVNSFLEEYNRYQLQVLTIHEAYPGHYVQLTWANQNPSLIRRTLQSAVYVEGWAVYLEQAMLDLGYGDGDPALRLIQLKMRLRSLANAILDHKMHCAGMTDQQAMDLLVDRAFQSDGEARLKVIRSKQSSCQLSVYSAGKMALGQLRQQFQNELGDRFDLGRYHEAVLEVGPVPVKFLPELVRERLSRPR